MSIHSTTSSVFTKITHCLLFLNLLIILIYRHKRTMLRYYGSYRVVIGSKSFDSLLPATRVLFTLGQTRTFRADGTT